MYLLFFIVWIIFNGKITLEIIILGLIIAAIMYAFVCKFMDYSIKKDLFCLKKSGQILYYIIILLFEIIKASMATIGLIISFKTQIEPVVVTFKTDLKTKMAKMILANSITLTPGTITVSLEEDEYVVHCIDKEMAIGLSDSIFVTLLTKMEEGVSNE